MSLLPVFLKAAGRLCLVAGAGRVASDKIATLRKAGLKLRVVAPRVAEEVRALAEADEIELRERVFEAADLDGVWLAIAATDVPEVNAEVYRLAGERGILANSVDDIPNCDFFFGSIVERGELQIAISTGGQSPALAQRLRREIDAQLPGDLGPWLDQVGSLRREVLAAMPAGEERRLLLHELAQRETCSSALCPTRQLAQRSRKGAQAGTVYLVGAGPGDPDLLTVKAVRLIESADVILHDDLVSAGVLALGAQAERMSVGKRCGVKLITQEQIHAHMVSLARAGRSVVRLKSGDPMLFGRGAEEMAALTLAGVPFEVVPGISAAFAAAASAGISLTDRKGASSVILTTGHHAPDRVQQEEWADATRVVYMPGRDGQRLAEELMASGLPADLPCVLVARASHPDQRVIHTTLGQMGQFDDLEAPSLLIAGWAAKAPAVGSEREETARTLA
jgi:uroporphyrin-III C-methyltransferase/precorrin-2 dehydrogenase/sirohydrochlorin ferrochelatase